MTTENVKIQVDKASWREELFTFSTILGISELPAQVLDYDGPTILKPGEEERLGNIQTSRFLNLVLTGEAIFSYEEFYFVLRHLKTTSAELARAMGASRTTFSNFKATGKLDKRVVREVAILFSLELHAPGTLKSLAENRAPSCFDSVSVWHRA